MMIQCGFRRSLTLTLGCCALAFAAQAQETPPPTIETVTTNCGGGYVDPPPPGPRYENCGVHLVNHNTRDRIVVSLERRIRPPMTMLMWDSEWAETTVSFEQEEEVLLRPGQKTLLRSVIIPERSLPISASPRLPFDYRISGYVVPRPDDINDRPPETPGDYFRIFERRDQSLNGSPVCQLNGVNEPAVFYAMINLHFTRRIAVTVRNRASRYGANPSWRVVILEPHGDADHGLGCVTDRDHDLIDMRDVRFVG